MSQVFSIRRVKHIGAPVYLGDTDGQPVFSANPQAIIEWMCNGWRTRFNQHRSKRMKGVWEDDPDKPGHRRSVRDSDGKKVLVPLGESVTDVTDKQAREQFSWLAAMPDRMLQSPERIESTEWWAATKRRRTLTAKGKPAGAMPRFRDKSKGLNFIIWHHRNAEIHRTGRKSGVLVITGSNPKAHGGKRWRITITVRLSQDVQPYTSVQVDWTHKRVVLVGAPPVKGYPDTDATVGVDRGVTHAIATSDGEFIDVPDTTKAVAARKRHQRAMARSKSQAKAEGRNYWESARYQEHKRLAAKHSDHIANVRREFAEQVSHRLVRDHALVAFEKLNVPAMTTRGRGKRGLNRSILESAWGLTLRRTQQKAEAAGRTVVLVPAAYTSQRCHKCSHTSPDNRKSQAVFSCMGCGWTGNADINAALNIEADGLKGWTGPAARGGKTSGVEDLLAHPDDLRTPALR